MLHGFVLFVFINVFTVFLFLKLTESNITLRVRQVDIPLVESLIDNIQQQYKQKIKKDITLKIDADNFLPTESCGGVELLASKGNYVIKMFYIVLRVKFVRAAL